VRQLARPVVLQRRQRDEQRGEHRGGRRGHPAATQESTPHGRSIRALPTGKPRRYSGLQPFTKFLHGLRIPPRAGSILTSPRCRSPGRPNPKEPS
jgi:hypothetical protein